MFGTKIISLLVIILLLSIGCKDVPTTVEDAYSAANKNTLNESYLGYEESLLSNYWYDLDDRIEAKFLFYNDKITWGLNSVSPDNKHYLNPFRDTLYFRTYPDYTVQINGTPKTIKYILNLTPGTPIEDYSKLYRLDETDTKNGWCDAMLVEYNGTCPEQVEVSFDYSICPTCDPQHVEDTLYSPAISPSLISKKEVVFNFSWKNIDSLKWDTQNHRYRQQMFPTAYTKLDTLIYNTDIFDSLFYVGIIDVNRNPVDSLVIIDRTEWERYDSTFKSSSKTITLDTTYEYTKIKIHENSPMYRVNTDCNQNLTRDLAEEFFDYGADWCPDSLETGAGKCDAESAIGDIVPCNCLGDWRETIGGIANPNWVGSDLNLINPNWVIGSKLDPNGDNWRDCGWDGKCAGDPGYDKADNNETENNGKWDTNEGIEENGQYDIDIITKHGDYFIDLGNGVVDKAEFCVKEISGFSSVCDGNDPFEDRNCNKKWDDKETVDVGNGIWDDAEAFIDTPPFDGEWDDGDGNFRNAEKLYTLSDRLETFLVDYSNPSSPRQVSNLDTLTSVTLFYGTIDEPDDSILISYSSENFLYRDSISADYSESFYDIDSVVAVYTNKIIERLPQVETDDYKITKTRWFQDIVATPYDEAQLDNPQYGNNYGYDYHLFKTSDNGFNINKMIHPAYFNFYGYYNSLNELELGSWRKESAEEEIYIYTYNGLLRSGEEYYTDTTIVTDVADYYIENLYEVSFDSSVVVPFKRVTYLIKANGDTACTVPITIDPVLDWRYDPPFVHIDEDWFQSNYRQNCPYVDTTLKNTFKITKTKTITMIGSGLELGLRNTFWLGTEEVNENEFKPLGIVKDQLEMRWSEPYWQDYGSGWNLISRLELRSLRKTASESTGLLRIFQPIKHLSLSQFVNEEIFNFEPYVLNSSYGIHKLRLPYEK